MSGFFRVLLGNMFAPNVSHPCVPLVKISIPSKENMIGIGPAIGKALGQAVDIAHRVRGGTILKGKPGRRRVNAGQTEPAGVRSTAQCPP